MLIDFNRIKWIIENQKKKKLLDKPNNFEFMTRKWFINDPSNANYDVGNEIIYKTEVLKSNLCDYNDAYILAKCDITVIAAPATKVSSKNCVPFTKCITKIDETAIDNAEDLDLVMLINNVIEYSWSYSETTISLWFFSKDEASNFNADIANKIILNLSKIRLDY